MFLGISPHQVARKVSRRNHRGRPCYAFASSTTEGMLLSMESYAEQQRALLLDIDPRVEFFHEQPWTLDLLSGEIQPSRKHFTTKKGVLRALYTPDFYVRFRDGKVMVLEVKPEAVSPTLQEKYTRAAQLLQEHGCEFRVQTSDCITPELLVNCAYLKRTFAEYLRPTLPSVLRRLSDLAEQQQVWHVENLAKNTPHGVFDVYIGLANGVFKADLFKDLLTPEATVQAAVGDLSHLQLGLV